MYQDCFERVEGQMTPERTGPTGRGRGGPQHALLHCAEVLAILRAGQPSAQIVALDLAGKASFCDRMVIASGLADRQITAMAQHLREKLHAAGQKRVQIEGLGGSDWVLIDAGDIVVHLFMPEARAMYGREKMWGEDLDELVAS